jgi:hypothetical protein
VADAEAEAENAAEVLEEAESVQAAQAESEGLSAEELAIESVPVAEDVETPDSKLDETESATSDE